MSDPSAPEQGPAPAPAPAVPGRGEQAGRKARDTRFWVTVVVGALVVAYVIGLVVDNSRRVRIGYVFGHANANLVWIVGLALALGYVLGLATVVLWRRRRRPAKPR